MHRVAQIILLIASAIIFIGASGTDNKKHVVKRGETLYSLARTYSKSVSEIAKANSISTKTEIKIGQVLLIPGVASAAKSTASVPKFTPRPVASTPDTPYRDEDNRSRTSDVLALATETNDEVMAALPKPQVSGLRTSSSDPAEYPGIFNQYPTLGFKINKTKGSANYLRESTMGNQFLAFYSKAETGSIIRITNLLNHKTIFAKVMGKVPAGDATNDVLLKLTSSAAVELGVEEDKFLVEVASFSFN